VWTEIAIRSGLVPIHADPLGNIQNEGDRQNVILAS
jgi:hypothetical protein